MPALAGDTPIVDKPELNGKTQRNIISCVSV